jgi:hypothetical protein
VRRACLLFPENEGLAADWHPLLAPTLPGDPELDWGAQAIFKPQGTETFGLTGVPLAVLGRSVTGTLARDRERVERFFSELFEEFDQVRGTPLEADFARALPPLEASLPADLWQRYLGAVDPTPVELTVQRLSMTPPGAGPGEAVTFRAEVANRGSGPAAPFTVQVDVDGTPLRVFTVPDLPPGATTAVEFPGWTAHPGTYVLRATADVSSAIAEPVEQDNTLERRFVIGESAAGPPDLGVAGVSLDPVRPRAGQVVAFVARVRNTGGNALDAFTVRFAVDGATIGEVVVPGLPAGEATEVRSPGWPASPRSHELRIGADAFDAVAEKLEDNNELARRFRVRLRRAPAGR